MKPPRSLLFVVVSILAFDPSPPLRAQDEAVVTAALKELQPGHSLDAQLDALRRISTSLDPRIPTACLPLLSSSGDSIRRKAARAIGSRWHQISKSERPTYLRSLNAKRKSDDSALANMTTRAVGLIDRTYNGDMFSRSADRRWVIYERRGRPCLIDTQTDTEELLGPKEDEIWFMPSIGNEPVKPHCLWHPKREMVALKMLIFRRTTLVWIWRHKTGLRPISQKDLITALKPSHGRILPNSWFAATAKSWNNEYLNLTVESTLEKDGEVTEQVSEIRWNSDTDQFQVISNKLNP